MSCFCGGSGTSRGLGFLPVSPCLFPPRLFLPLLLLLLCPPCILNLKRQLFLQVRYFQVKFGDVLRRPPFTCVPFTNWPPGGEIVLTQRVRDNSGGRENKTNLSGAETSSGRKLVTVSRRLHTGLELRRLWRAEKLWRGESNNKHGGEKNGFPSAPLKIRPFPRRPRRLWVSICGPRSEH